MFVPKKPKVPKKTSSDLRILLAFLLASFVCLPAIEWRPANIPRPCSMDGSHSSTASSPSGRAAKVGKLLPKSLATRRPWNKQPSKESFVSSASSEDVPRGRSPHGRDQPPYGDGMSSSTRSSSNSRPATDALHADGHERGGQHAESDLNP